MSKDPREKAHRHRYVVTKQLPGSQAKETLADESKKIV